MDLATNSSGEITAQVPVILWEAILSTAREFDALSATALGVLLDAGRCGMFRARSS